MATRTQRRGGVLVRVLPQRPNERDSEQHGNIGNLDRELEGREREWLEMAGHSEGAPQRRWRAAMVEMACGTDFIVEGLGKCV